MENTDFRWFMTAIIFFSECGGAWLMIKRCRKYLPIGRYHPGFRKFCKTLLFIMAFSFFFASISLAAYGVAASFTPLTWGLVGVWLLYVFWEIRSGRQLLTKFTNWQNLTEEHIERDPTIIQPRLLAREIKYLPTPSNAKALELYQKAGYREAAAYYAKKLNETTTLEVIRWYEEALTMEPGGVTLHAALGTALARLRRVEEAMEHFFRANEIVPENAWIEANLARCYYELKNYAEALKWWQEANARKNF